MASDSPNNEKIPDKSGRRYIAEYEKFMKWHKTQNTNSFSEEVMLSYFGEMAKILVPSTLFSQYSMLKPMISSKHNEDIGQYSELITFLRKMKKDFISSTQLREFSTDEVNRFLREAPDSEYVVVKAVTVFAIYVSPRSDTLVNITMDCITDYGTEIVVRVENPWTKQIHVCTISGEMVDPVRNYMRLRPNPISTDRFFIQYRNKKCTAQHVAKQTIAKMPQKIAQFIGWPESDILTGLTFRRMSNSVLANTKRKQGSLEKGVVSTSSTAFEVSQQATALMTKTMGPTQGSNDPKNANEETNNIDPSERIKQEDELDFEAGEYILSDTNFYSHQNSDAKPEDEPVHDKTNSQCNNHGNVKHLDDRNTTKITRITSEQQQHHHDLTDSLASDTYPNKRLKCSGDGEMTTNDTEATCLNNSLCQQTIQTQAKEITRLKKLTERQNMKIDSLETLLLDNLRKKFESS